MQTCKNTRVSGTKWHLLCGDIFNSFYWFEGCVCACMRAGVCVCISVCGIFFPLQFPGLCFWKDVEVITVLCTELSFVWKKKKINYSFNKCYHFVHRAGVLSVLCRWRNCREKTVSMNGDQVGEQPKEEGHVWCWDSSIPALNASAVFPWQSISSASRVCQ